MPRQNKQIKWFTEGDLPFSEQNIRLSVRVDKVVYDQNSDFGHVQILDTPFFGRILILDGIIQIAEKTEFIYHEMMVTLPCLYHGDPKKVLIIGGGDGGAAKKALQVRSVEKITQVEIDRTIIDVCKKFMPSLAEGSLEDEKVELIVGDGMAYVKDSREKYDVIVLDVSDPVPGGPAEGLVSPEFYADVQKCLNKDGVMLTHCGSLIFQDRKAKKIVDGIQKVFDNVTMHVALVPEFELTEFGFLVCYSNGKTLSNGEINNRYTRLIARPSQYLTPEVFFSSKVLPPYIQKLSGVKNK